MRALVVGGTAATGPPIVRRLLQRGYDVTLYHRGLHEVDDLPDDLEHIHGEPHFEETIARDLAGRSFDLVVATYGRIRHLAEALEGKTPRLITIGGFPVMKGWMHVRDPHNAEHDGPVLTPGFEENELEEDGVDAFVDRMMETERAVMDRHAAGHYRGNTLPLSVRLWPAQHRVERVADHQTRPRRSEALHHPGRWADTQHALRIGERRSRHRSGDRSA